MSCPEPSTSPPGLRRPPLYTHDIETRLDQFLKNLRDRKATAPLTKTFGDPLAGADRDRISRRAHKLNAAMRKADAHPHPSRAVSAMRDLSPISLNNVLDAMTAPRPVSWIKAVCSKLCV